ncbi:HD domain-containing protein [Kutzneria buriramensis]|uniref:HD domain-containing protein n=1 Tax=Kutzneria buriramensis TaxID=1045776 RepID=A0A3E0IAG6_9PSEU|nr:HD domain-containing protein [Kutzneria buriramensis]REH55629.1 HD domain-containing protein [Kutzneria buriramensis]
MDGVPSDVLRRALTESDLRPLPAAASELLARLSAPPRLAAHLRAVHDVAAQLTEWFADRLTLDTDAVLFGAATHDIGKIVHVEELSGPGHRHEPAGRDLLLAHGVPPELARFAASHASWTEPGITAEELVVSLADKIWKAKRVPDLEQLVIARLAGEPWQAFLDLDDELTRIAATADHRLAFQSAYPI